MRALDTPAKTGTILARLETGTIPVVADYPSFDEAKKVIPDLDIPTEELWIDSVKANIRNYEVFISSLKFRLEPIGRPEIMNRSSEYIITKHVYRARRDDETIGSVVVFMIRIASETKLVSVKISK